MTIFIRTDGNESIGLGHLMRCLALAQEFAVRHVDVMFFVRNQSLEHCFARHDWVGKIQIVPDSVELSDEANWLAQHNAYQHCSLILLDGYQFDEPYRKKLSQLSPPLALFDDVNDSGLLHCEAVINGAKGSDCLGYQKSAPEALLMCGEAYRVLRQEFLLVPNIPIDQRNSIAVVMGGADKRGDTLKIINLLSLHDTDIPLRVLTGSAFTHKEQLELLIRQLPNPVQHVENCQSVADIFVHCRLAISACGLTQFELHSCGTPGVFFATADNQLYTMKQLNKSLWAMSFNAIDGDFEEGVRNAVSVYHNPKAIEKMHSEALDSMDNTGVIRVVDELQTLIL